MKQFLLIALLLVSNHAAGQASAANYNAEFDPHGFITPMPVTGDVLAVVIVPRQDRLQEHFLRFYEPLLIRKKAARLRIVQWAVWEPPDSVGHSLRIASNTAQQGVGSHRIGAWQSTPAGGGMYLMPPHPYSLELIPGTGLWTDWLVELKIDPTHGPPPCMIVLLVTVEWLG